MTEQQAIKIISDEKSWESDDRKIDAFIMAIDALEEIKTHRELERKLNGVDLTMLVNDFIEIAEEEDVQGYQRGRILTNVDADKWDAYLLIGTPEEIEQKLSELERWHTTEVNPKIKNVFANTSTIICHNCDHKDEYIEELEAETEEYREIGTPEECRAAVDKQKEKKPKQQGIVDSNGKFHTWNGINGKPYLLCPNCGTNLCCEMSYDKKPKYCDDCGQKLDWSDKK